MLCHGDAMVMSYHPVITSLWDNPTGVPHLNQAWDDRMIPPKLMLTASARWKIMKQKLEFVIVQVLHGAPWDKHGLTMGQRPGYQWKPNPFLTHAPNCDQP